MAIVCMRADMCVSVCEWVKSSLVVRAFDGVVVFRPHQISVCKCVPDSQSFAQKN